MPSGIQIWIDPEVEEIRLYSRDGVVEPRPEGGVADACERDDQMWMLLKTSSKGPEKGLPF